MDVPARLYSALLPAKVIGCFCHPKRVILQNGPTEPLCTSFMTNTQAHPAIIITLVLTPQHPQPSKHKTPTNPVVSEDHESKVPSAGQASTPNEQDMFTKTATKGT
eukprot:6490782-Amphidinium_carterae.2